METNFFKNLIKQTYLVKKLQRVTKETALIIYDSLVHAEATELFSETELQQKLTKVVVYLEDLLEVWDTYEREDCLCGVMHFSGCNSKKPELSHSGS